MIKKTMYFLIGLALLPVTVIAARVFVALLLQIPGDDDSGALFPAPLLSFAGGMGVWLLIAVTRKGPLRAYILAHELTHALWGWATGAKVSAIDVRKNRGSVTLSKINFLTVLSPYFFPFYAFLIAAVYFVAGLFVPVERFQSIWLALSGAAWGFHLTFTLDALAAKQSDIACFGHLFSYALIALGNIVALIVWVIPSTSVTVATALSLADQDIRFVWTIVRRVVTHIE